MLPAEGVASADRSVGLELALEVRDPMSEELLLVESIHRCREGLQLIVEFVDGAGECLVVRQPVVLPGGFCRAERFPDLLGFALRRTLTVVEQVQYIDGEFVTSQPKTKAGRRSVALPRLVADELDAHLRSYAEARSDAVVFPAPEGGYLRFDNFRNRVWTPATVDAGLAPLRPHDLRHTCASLAIAAGADIKVPQRMLGHSSAVLTLDRYGHLFPGQAESVADRLDEMARASGVVHRTQVVSIDRSSS